ncbi:MAG: molybdopterin oxidoreductase family protein, partial [Chloroflexota bacterium]
VILIDPRENQMTRFASVWLRASAGSDLAAINGMLRVILDDQLVDQAFVDANCEGFAELAAQVNERGVEEYAAQAGVSVEDLRKAAHLFASGGTDQRYPIPESWFGLFVTPGQRPGSKSSAIVYAGGLVHHPNAADSVQALANLSLVTGMIGKDGSGICPLTDENNTQGACDVGVLPTYWPGYAPVGEVEMATRLEQAWGIAAPTGRGRSLSEMLEAARTGAIKALVVVGANPAGSLPGGAQVEAALKNLKLLVVSDIFPTHTTKIAHVVFSAAAAAEKDGTFTNTERRIQRVRAAIPPVGVSRPDWYILSELANRIANKLGKLSTFTYNGPADVMSEIARVVPFYGGVSYDKIDQGGLQWPIPTADHPGTPYLFRDGFGDRKATLAPARYQPAASPAEFPLVAASVRDLAFGTGVMADHSRRLTQMKGTAHVELNDADAHSLGIAAGDQVRITSAHGKLELAATLSHNTRSGHLSIFAHYADGPERQMTEFIGQTTGMPELRAIPVRIERLHGSTNGKA